MPLLLSNLYHVSRTLSLAPVINHERRGIYLNFSASTSATSRIPLRARSSFYVNQLKHSPPSSTISLSLSYSHSHCLFSLNLSFTLLFSLSPILYYCAHNVDGTYRSELSSILRASGIHIFGTELRTRLSRSCPFFYFPSSSRWKFHESFKRKVDGLS